MPLPRPWWPTLGLSLLFASGALAMDLDLDGVVQNSQAIVVAHPAQPASRKESIDITPAGQAPDAVKYPAYVRHLSRWVVDESLLPGGPQKGAVLEIDEAEWGISLEVHRRYHLEHVEKLPDWTAYRSATVLRDGAPADARRVVFLQKLGQGWAFTARGSLEPVSELARVKQALPRSAQPQAPAKGR